MSLAHTSLGKETVYPNQYDRTQLFPIERAPNRKELGILPENLPFHGRDVWNAYEISWLNPKGKPQTAIGLFTFPCHSPYLLESKSFKLYLGSFNSERIESMSKLLDMLISDLSHACGAPVEVTLQTPEEANQSYQIQKPDGVCLDNLDVEIDTYTPNSALLKIEDSNTIVEEKLYSHVLKSNCPVTSQPDWATVFITYQGPKINHESLLKYIISYRDHTEFHEQCVERIFQDIKTICKPASLTVEARYTRRGGLDINPIRSTEKHPFIYERLVRQ